MIGIPELLIVIGALALAGGYVLIIHHLLERADKAGDGHHERRKQSGS